MEKANKKLKPVKKREDACPGWRQDCPCVPVPMFTHHGKKATYKLTGLYETEEEAYKKTLWIISMDGVQAAQGHITVDDFDMWAVYRQM
ncbi:MAG: hypothetical protein WC562_05410 [Dehalococcoidia bacterium]